MVTEFTPILFAVDPIITPILLTKLFGWLALGTAAASIVIQILDSVVDIEWGQLSYSQRNKVKKIYAKAYKFWQNNSPKIKFCVDFISSLGDIVTSSQSISSWSSVSTDAQNALTNQGSISQEYTVS